MTGMGNRDKEFMDNVKVDLHSVPSKLEDPEKEYDALAPKPAVQEEKKEAPKVECPAIYKYLLSPSFARPRCKPTLFRVSHGHALCNLFNSLDYNTYL